MSILLILVPISLFLGCVGMLGFFWTLRSDQYDDLDGSSMRILSDQYDEKPKPQESTAPKKR